MGKANVGEADVGEADVDEATDPIWLSRPTFGDEEVQAVRAALESGWVAGQGPRGHELEARFAAMTGVDHAVALNNCTAALHLALVALGAGPGDEVIVADYTYPATGHAVMFTGATPVFADVRPDLCTVDPAAVEAAITERTVGVVAVDALGQCADYSELRAITGPKGLFLVDDAACSVGATYQGRPVGSLADVTCFSLHARKGITSGEGGVLVTGDARVGDDVRKRSCFGVTSAFERQASDELPIPVFEVLGYNYKLSDILAAVALVQLDRLPGLLARRRAIAAAYGEIFADLEEATTPTQAPDREHTWQAYALTLDPDVPRNRVAQELRTVGVQVNIGTYACHRQPVYGPVPECPVSGSLFDRQLAIPMHPELTDAEVERAADVVKKVVRSHAR